MGMRVREMEMSRGFTRERVGFQRFSTGIVSGIIGYRRTLSLDLNENM